jgi:signal recognition particle subunit SRP54
MEEDKALELQRKIKKATLTLEDFRDQLQQVKKMGPLKELMALVPGMGGMDMSGAEEELPRIEAIISSMTPEERRDPEVIDSSRRRRIGAGSGADPSEVNQLLKQFKQMKKMLKQFSGRAAPEPASAGGVSLKMPVKPGVITGRHLGKRRHGKKRR